MSDDKQTEATDVEQLHLAHAYLELQVLRGGLREYRFPFYESEMDLSGVAAEAFPDGVAWKAKLQDDGVLLIHAEGERRRLAVGEKTILEGQTVWLVDARKPPIGSLEAITQPFAGQVWHLRNHQTWLGRYGKRLNHIELDHPAVSRTQATFVPDGEGGIAILAESPASPTTVNGRVLPPGETITLKNGDLLSFGPLKFRFSG